MNEQAASLAALNVSLLEAIKAGRAADRQALAERAGIVVNNLNRKLDSLLEAGLIEKTGEGTCAVSLTDTGQRGLRAMSVWRGEPQFVNELDPGTIMWIAFDQIDGWAGNPRTQFEPASIEDMAQSIADKGVLQPLTVRRKKVPSGAIWYEVIIGERRRRGARLAVERGWVAKNFLVPCQVRDWSDDEALDVAGVENLQRQDLHWMDEARFYLRLAERGRSGPEIARLAGESVSKRKVQDYCKIARELAAEDQARAYLPEGDKNRLLYVQARDLVGEKKEKPALDLSAKLAVTFLEAIHAGVPSALAITGKGFPTGMVTTRFHKAPVGGPLATLEHDRKLLTFGFERGDLVARIPITDEVRRWLTQIGYAESHANALRITRAAVVGDLLAAQLHREARFFTAELNPPAPAERASEDTPTHPTPAPEPQPQEPAPASSAHSPAEDAFVPPPQGEGDREVVEGASAQTPDDEWDAAAPATDDELPPYLQRLAGIPSSPSGEVAAHQPEGASAQTPAPGVRPPAFYGDTPGGEPKLPPMLAIVVVELAHALSARGIERGPGTWAVPILAGWHIDTRGPQLVQGRKMLAFMPQGEKTLCAIGRAGRDWLAETYRIESPDGRPRLSDGSLSVYQEMLIGGPPAMGATYHTAWLNRSVPSSSPSGEVDRPEAETEGASAQIPGKVEERPGDADPRDRTIADLGAALRQADRLLAKHRTSKPNPAEIDQVRNWIGDALAAAGLAEPA